MSVLFVFSGVFTPSCVELTSSDYRGNLQTLRLAGVDFPFGKFIFTLTIV
jgi:peroxiredoxin